MIASMEPEEYVLPNLSLGEVSVQAYGTVSNPPEADDEDETGDCE